MIEKGIVADAGKGAVLESGRASAGRGMGFLFELGLEEMPASYMPGAIANLREGFLRMFNESRLTPSDPAGLKAFGTPRRLVIMCEGVPSSQEDRTVELRGPAKAVAFDEDGNPTRAGLGFARSQGVDPAGLEVKATPAGEYVFAVKVEKGLPAARVLSEAIPSLISSLDFPRSMRWGTGEYAFARPVRWVLAMLGDAVLDMDIAGVKPGNVTYGHRVLGPGPFKIANVGEYLNILRDEGRVIVNQDERRDEIGKQVRKVASQEGGQAFIEPDLLEQVTYLVEWPTAFAGRFSPDYLSIPEAVLVTTMKRHQRYFPVYDPKGNRLLPVFVGVRNGDARGLDTVRLGNERVIRARLADASFFYGEDRKTRLEDRVESLKHIVFQEKMGTLYDKTQRIREICRRIGSAAGMDAAALTLVDRAALLSKTDLTTSMVREFTELQGIMGREYAKDQGEDPQVCEAMSEQYMPRQAGGDLPSTITGAVLSLADKADTISGCFLAGLIPSGSQDPYALRRQASGIVSILASQAGIRVGLGEIIDCSLGLHRFPALLRGLVPVSEPGAELKAAVLEFLKGRLKTLLEEAGIRYDVSEAVLEAGFDDVYGTVRRARALLTFSAEKEFPEMMVGFKRAANLAREATSTEVDGSLLSQAEEKALWERFNSARTVAEGYLIEENYGEFFRTMAGLREPVDGFLDKVLVMAEDPRIRNNRLALLANVAGLFGRAADLSRLVI